MAKHPVPKKRHSSSRRDKRRSHDALTPPTIVPCPRCGENTRPHTVCQSCGYYKNNRVIDVEGD